MSRRVTFRPVRRAGLGTGLLGFCVWVVIVALQLCWWTAKVLVVGAVLLLGALSAGITWVSNRHQEPVDTP